MKFLLIVFVALAGAAWLALKMADLEPATSAQTSPVENHYAVKKVREAQQQMADRPRELGKKIEQQLEN